MSPGLRRRLAMCGVFLAFWPGTASAHRPPAASTWWAGLDAAGATAHTDGVHALRAPASRRVLLQAGTFTMGSTPPEMTYAIELCEHEVEAPLCHAETVRAMVNSEGVTHEVTLSAFELDRREVSVAEYARCVSAGPCAPPGFAPDDPRFAQPSLPVTHVRWEDADSYCRWANGRLPTEAEWEYAARGVEGRLFPWGNLYNPHLANHGSWADDSTDGTDGFYGLAPVGSFPDGATPFGILDLAGNVSEWVADVFGFDAAGIPLMYSSSAAVDPKPNTVGGISHVVRGGSWADGAMWLRGAARDTTTSARSPRVGFRCAADVR